MIRRFARPYAKAMMDLVPSAEKAQGLHREIEAFERARAGSEELSSTYANPAVPVAAKVEITRSIAKKLKISDLGVRLLEVLVRHQRINDLAAVLAAWKEMINDALGVAVAEVRSAHELDAAEQQSLKQALEQRVGRKVELRLSKDESLLGGFVARVGSEVYDASAMGRLQRFRDTLS